MLSLSTLGGYLKKNPGIMKDRTLLQGVLRDVFPQDKLAVNLLLMGVDENIFSLIGTSPSHARLMKLVNSIVSDYGVTQENAEYIVETWLVVIFQENLPAGFGGNIQPQTAHTTHYSHSLQQSHSASSRPIHHPQHQNYAGLSLADVREVFFRTKGRLMGKCKFARSQDMETWDVINRSGNKHYSRNLSQREKGLIIKKLGKGRYTDADFAYIRTRTDMVLSWGVTYESLVVSAQTDLKILFSEIEHVECERGFFTDTMTIYRKGGDVYELDEHQMMSTPVYDNISDLVDFLNVIKDM